jgi:site-specific DNA-methyltransferase (adenine-specific)
MIQITNEDNMNLMARYPDNHFDLAIVDPPYGININENLGLKKGQKKRHKKKVLWDSEIPTNKYFEELNRVSKNQIIWGGNYFGYIWKNGCRHFIFWDKNTPLGMSFSDGELAWTSFDRADRKFNYTNPKYSGKIHPTQKPVKLYEWLLMNYAKEGDKILDTHLGSGSIALACHNLKYDLTGCELDKEYYDSAMLRLNNHQSQTRMF